MIEEIGTLLNRTGLALLPVLLAPITALVLAFTGRLPTKFANLLEHGALAADRVNKSVAAVVIWLALAMALVQFTIVILRYVFGVSFLWMQESMTYMHGSVFLLAAGYALYKDAHVRVDIFYREASAKHKAIVNLIGTYLFLFPVCILAILTAGPYVSASWLVQEGSAESSGIQAVFLLKSLIPAFAVLLILQGFAVASRASLALTSREL